MKKCHFRNDLPSTRTPVRHPKRLGLPTAVSLHSNRVSSNWSLCFRATDFCAQRRRRRNIPEKFTETLAETKLTPNKSANWAVITGWPGNLLGSRNAWWGWKDSNFRPSGYDRPGSRSSTLYSAQQRG